MSEPIPESIPTSHDPRSKRPTKRLALTPTSQQATQLTALFAKPDRDIPIPSSDSSLSKSRTLAPPPEIVANVQGSSAGAGSGEFHVYKASRRREYERLRLMDEEVKMEKENEDFEKKQEDMKRKDAAKTNKNKARRDKLKAKKAGTLGGKEGGGEDSMNGIQKSIGGKQDGKVTAGDNLDHTPTSDDESPAAGSTAILQEIGVVIHDDD